MKRLEFLGDSLEQLREFPEAARKEAGVQQGFEPSEWKPIASVGQGGGKSVSATRPEPFGCSTSPR